MVQGKLLYCIGRTLYQADNNVREERARQIASVVNNRSRGQIGARFVHVSPRTAYELVDTYNLSGAIEYPEGMDELIQSSESEEEIRKQIKEANGKETRPA